MRPRAKTHLWDMLQAASALQEYCTGKRLEDYQSPVSAEYRRRASAGGLRKFDIFDFALNGVG